MYTKEFIYLIQGQRELVEGYLHLGERSRCDALFLTYDEPLDGAVYFPNSTWGEGRNHLLRLARIQGPYHYYVFADDDAGFERGTWQDFENRLLAWTPAVGVPVVPRTAHTTIPLARQPFGLNDELLMGVHHDVVQDNLLFPYQTLFDSVHWWGACHIQEILIQTLYRDRAIQFNDISVNNECAHRYDNPDAGRTQFKPLVRDWLDSQLVDGYRDIEYDTGQFHWRAWRRTLKTAVRTRGSRTDRHALPPQRAAGLLAPGSTLLKQYDSLDWISEPIETHSPVPQ